MQGVIPLHRNDRAQWETLWQESVDGVMTTEVIDHSFENIMNGNIHAFVVKNGGDIVGLLHFVTHPVAGCMHPVCYMQDLYVTPKFRRKGVARQLIETLETYAEGKALDRIYWLLDNTNMDAKEFYKNLGISLDFGLYMIPIKMRERLNLPNNKDFKKVG